MKYALVYGLLSGLVVASTILVVSFGLAEREGFFASEYFGYLVMLVALAFIFVGVKRYRDVEKGGVIKFLPALGMGLAIAGVAALAYCLVWEIYLASTGYRFMDDYIAAIAEARRAEGASPAAVAAEVASWDGIRQNYANPLFRIPMTFIEIFPVGLLVALVSAALLRNPKLLPPSR